MTPQEQNIAIAEACGWTIADQGEDGAYLMRRPDGEGCEYWKDDMHQACNILKMPSYTTDLNAMHEAEKVLSRGEHYNQTGGFGRYKTALAEVCDEQHPIDATAAQRAEAFGLTLGLWKHGE
jgi:hypothetical protein